MKALFEYLANEGMTDPVHAIEKFKNISAEKAGEIGTKIHELISLSKPTLNTKSKFNFAAGPTLSGDIYPCANIACRLKNIQRLSAFSVLYADNVVIEDFFRFLHHGLPEFHSDEQRKHFIKNALGSVLVLFHWQPLIEAGVVQFNPTPYGVCKNCSAKRIKEETGIDFNMVDVESGLRDKLLSEINVVFEGPNRLRFNGAENYIGAETISLRGSPETLKEYRKHKEYRFSTKEVKDLELIEKCIIRPVFQDLMVQRFAMGGLNLSYLTDRKLEADIIDTFCRRDARDSNPKMLELLAHQIPVVETAGFNRNLLASLVSLRTNYGEMFDGYRMAISKVLKDANSLSGEEYKDAVNDVVAPELNKIDRLIRANKEDFATRAKTKVTVNTIILGAGMFLPMPANILASGYALTKIVDDVIGAASTPVAAKQSDYYFLWQARDRIKQATSKPEV